MLFRSKLIDTPSCEPCSLLGRDVSAVHVDHRVAIRNGGPAFPALDGLASMCVGCHNRKTRALDLPGGAGFIAGASVDGMPADLRHPFFGEGYTPRRTASLGAVDRPGGRAFSKFRRRGG